MPSLVMSFEMSTLCKISLSSYPCLYKQVFLKLMQPTQLKVVAGKVTWMRGDSNMVTIFPLLFQQRGLVEGEEDI